MHASKFSMENELFIHLSEARIIDRERKLERKLLLDLELNLKFTNDRTQIVCSKTASQANNQQIIFKTDITAAARL